MFFILSLSTEIGLLAQMSEQMLCSRTFCFAHVKVGIFVFRSTLLPLTYSFVPSFIRAYLHSSSLAFILRLKNIS